ncbi:MAG: GH92 family glycosyl hydrolase, partial [Acidobacteriota bacterium]
SMEDENESVSKTLEYAYDDWCIAQMALQLLSFEDINSKDAAIRAKAKSYGADMTEFGRRSHAYENLFDPSTGFMRPKKNGGFVSPFAPSEVTFNYTEGNAWVYSFFALQDIPNLIRLHGGKAGFEKMLDGLFTTTDKLTGREQPDITGLIGQYAHGNEPSHHIAYLYNSTDAPWKTQKYVRHILDDFYKPTPDGLIGNEDCGQMSAWYVLSASGIYPVPPFGIFELGTPLFKEVKFNLENGKTFVVRAKNVSAANMYVASARLDQKRLDRPELSFAEMMKGGVLEFDMSPTPVLSAYSPAGYYGEYFKTFTAVPSVGDGRRTFQGSLEVPMQTITPNSKIYFTLDGSEPTERSMLYIQPVKIDKTTTVKALAINERGVRSQVASATYNLIPNNWTVSIASKYNRQYTGGGDAGLIDGIRGTTSFASGEWQGYQGQDFVATVDLQKETEIKKVGGGFLQNAGSWIWMPTHIAIEVSDDNVNFRQVADIKTDIAPTDMESKVRDYTQSIASTRARFVRIHAYNLGKIPSWHPGAGDDAFIFVDEIIIQ